MLCYVVLSYHVSNEAVFFNRANDVEKWLLFGLWLILSALDGIFELGLGSRNAARIVS